MFIMLSIWEFQFNQSFVSKCASSPEEKSFAQEHINYQQQNFYLRNQSRTRLKAGSSLEKLDKTFRHHLINYFAGPLKLTEYPMITTLLKSVPSPTFGSHDISH